MKKTILGISFMLMAAFAGSASAQTAKNTSCANPENCNKEQCEQKNCNNCDNKDCKTAKCTPADCKVPTCGKDVKREMHRGNMPGRCEQACAFEGLNLSEEQKAKVQDLNKALEASKQEMKENAKAEGKRPNMREASKELRMKYLEDLKKILSGEQYTEFLQNFYVNQGAQPNPFKAGAQRMDRKIQGEKRLGEKEFNKDKKIVSEEAKKLEKSVEKDVKKMEKKAEKKAK